MEQQRSVNLLVVEDDDVDALNLRRAFRDSELVSSITRARNGEDALRKLRGGEVPRERLLVLLDLHMPGVDGLEFLRRVREDRALRNLIVIVMSRSEEDEDVSCVYELNAAGYLRKPRTRKALSDCMQSLARFWSRVDFPQVSS